MSGIRERNADLFHRQMVVSHDLLETGTARKLTEDHFDRHARLRNYWTTVHDLWVYCNPWKYLFGHCYRPPYRSLPLLMSAD